jgi:hypothetical protein
MSTLISRLYNWATDKANGVKITAARVDAEMDQVVTALNRKVLFAATAPANPINGQTWVDTTANLVKCYLSNDWVIIANYIYIQSGDPTGMSEGYLWYDTANNLLKSYDGSDWNTVGDMIYPTDTVQGDMLYFTGEKTLARLAKNTNTSRVLMNTGTNNAPAWGQLTRAAITEAHFALGSWVDKSASYGAQQAATDGFVLTYTADVSVYHTGYTDANADPTTIRAKGGANNANVYASICMPVKKGDYWKVVVSSGTPTVYWIPLGS